MTSKVSIVFLSLMLFFFSCHKDKKETVNSSASDTITKAKTEVPAQSPEQTTSEIDEPIFPMTGKTVNDFIPKNYKIDMDAEGDLNHDGLKDEVIILMKTKDSTAQRSAIVLLQQKDKSYRLDAKSFGIIEPKYREDGFLNYDYEDIDIEKNGQLVIKQQAMGPNGSIESIYQYIHGELILSHISTFNMGAGGQTELKIDLLKGVAEETDINTMDENMPSETTTKPYKSGKVLFENSDPRAIMDHVFR